MTYELNFRFFSGIFSSIFMEVWNMSAHKLNSLCISYSITKVKYMFIYIRSTKLSGFEVSGIRLQSGKQAWKGIEGKWFSYTSAILLQNNYPYMWVPY